VTLSESFYTEIIGHPIPLEREVVALLANAPRALDLYVWLTWKSWTVKGPVVRVPLFGNNGLAHQLGSGEYSLGRYFRRKLSNWLRYVRTLWPECPATLSDRGDFILIRSARSAPAVRPSR
jgi:hypothetical protein